jgi:hypothetical protein
MAKGSKGERRPADANMGAVMVARIATGEIEDKETDDGKNAAAVALGRMGGVARAKGMSKQAPPRNSEEGGYSAMGKETESRRIAESRDCR